MKKFLLSLVSAAVFTLTAVSGYAQKTTMVGGMPMYPTKNVVINASTAPNLTTLVAAVKAAALVDTLSSPGPFTVFAPTNDAFAKLPAGTVDNLVKPENKAMLTNILTYHVLSGRITTKDLARMIKEGHGKGTLKTVQGEPLTVWMQGGHLVLTDAKGNHSTITQANVYQSNGVAHIIDTVLMP